MYPEEIPETLQTTIEQWFGARHVADDTAFPLWFSRLLSRDYGRYHEMLRIEPGVAEYDYLVAVYRERRQDYERTPELTVSKSDVNRSTTHEKTVNVTHTQTHSGTDTTDDDLTTTHPVETVKTSHAVDAEHENYAGSTQTTLDKENPMSISYSGGVTFQAVSGGDGTGLITTPTSPDLIWQDPSSQSETGTVSRTTDKSKALAADNYDEAVRSFTGSDKTERDISVKHGHVITTVDAANGATNKDTITYAGSVDTETTGKDTSKRYDRYTGRDEAPADILKRAAEFISRTSAWEWLYSRLDTCFISVYDY